MMMTKNSRSVTPCTFHYKPKATAELHLSTKLNLYNSHSSQKCVCPSNDTEDSTPDNSFPLIKVPPHLSPKGFMQKIPSFTSRETTKQSDLRFSPRQIQVPFPSENVDDNDAEDAIPQIKQVKLTEMLYTRHPSQSTIANCVPSLKHHTIKEIKIKVRSARAWVNTHNIPNVFNDIHTMGSVFQKIKQSPKHVQEWTQYERKVEKEGYLWKGLSKKRKYCILKEHSFIWINVHGGKVIQGCIQFDLLRGAVDILPSGDSRSFIIAIRKRSKKWMFRDESTKNIAEWIKVLSHEICPEMLEPEPLLQINDNKFWKNLKIPESKFRRTAAPGDLILFQGKTMMNKFQRFLTRSRYDHVGLLFRDKKGRLQILEATGTEGVICSPWSDFIEKGWGSEYEMIVYRHLHCKRDSNTINRLAQFIKRAVGKKYSFSIIQYLAAFDSSDAYYKQSFFCSELVATAYIIMGVLTGKHSPTRYFPVDFSSERELEWAKGSYLDYEYSIDMTI